MKKGTHHLRSHAKFSPSDASRWLQCSGAIPLETQLVQDGIITLDEGNAAADYGTAAHELSEKCIKEKRLASFSDVNSHIGGLIDNKMIPYANCYIEFILEESLKHDHLLLERKLSKSKDLFGTVDAILFKEDVGANELKSLMIADLKFGKWAVPAERNKQLMVYAGMFLEEYQSYGGTVKDTCPVQLVICQPRVNRKPDIWRHNAGGILHFHQVVVAGAIKEANTAPRFIPSAKVCRFCSGRSHCDLAWEI